MNRVVKILIALVVLIVIVLLGAGMYFYNYAVVPSQKDFTAGDTPGTDVETKKPGRKMVSK